ncbi:MAG: F0F1 ATP synthase subunit delta [Amphiplicatus sp.]
MEINWVTVAAQIINFLVLVWLLRKFLYGPITKAMKTREELIKKRLLDAETAKQEADETRQSLEAAKSALEAAKEKFITGARQEADDLRRSLEKQAREDTDAMRQAWAKQLGADQEEFLSDIRRRAAREFFLLSREALKAVADESIDGRIVAAFVNTLEDLPADSLARLKDAVRRSDAEVKIESAFPISVEQRQTISRSVGDALGGNFDVAFADADDLVAGVRLSVDSQTVEWSINAYLDQFEERVSAALLSALPSEARRAAE